MDVDPDGFAALLAARLAAIVPPGFQVTLEDDMLWFRSDEGRFPGQQNDYHTGSTGLWPQEDLLTCLGYDGTAEECAADVARHALDTLQDYIAEATHDPWPGERTCPNPTPRSAARCCTCGTAPPTTWCSPASRCRWPNRQRSFTPAAATSPPKVPDLRSCYR
jgi:hypothetical protein